MAAEQGIAPMPSPAQQTFVVASVATDLTDYSFGEGVRDYSGVTVVLDPAAYTGTVDIQGRGTEADDWQNVRHAADTGDGALTVSNDQIALSNSSTSQTRRIVGYWPQLQARVQRTSGSGALTITWAAAEGSGASDGGGGGGEGGGGDASAANQATEIASLASIDGKIPALAAGALPVSLPAGQITTLTPPAAITGFATSAKQDTLAAQIPTTLGIKTAANSLSVAPASDAVFALGSASYGAAVAITRPGDTTTYGVGDVVGVTGGVTAALTFANMGPSGARIFITSASLQWRASSVPTNMGNFRLYFYNVTPPSAYLDNAVFDLLSGDYASFLDYIDLGTPSDKGSILLTKVDQVNCHLKLSGTSLFAYLVTDGNFQPGNAAVFQVTLHSIAV